ncbi:Hpt domain-containing protein [Maritalea porphyrae]|jgi:HPt (histidine-containing phosphotransfer) domain-containing protein|uniref:Hpt domain-containing protein n=1 Tax=Maritalea porphyrae TaxID=880732 RepID=UPI0022AFD6F5|nr:Hpt domain-containing protein [Maritalea porphyrae]MCZ4273241.1 Hpt domain-containing protein [Maritalea porphyrae]
MPKKYDNTNAQDVEVYTPPNKLREAIGEGDGPSLGEMQKMADQLFRASQSEYRLVLEGAIARMKDYLVSGDAVPELQAELYAEAHDIKGQASSFGFPLVAQVAERICFSIREVPEKLEARPDLLELHLSALSWAFVNQHNDDKLAEKDTLVRSLREAMAS